MRHLALQAGRQYCQTHNLDQADILFFDMMQLCMGMIDSQRMLLCGNIVTQHQIQFELVSSLSCNGSDGVMRLVIGVGIDKCLFIRIFSPLVQDHICQCNDTVSIRTAETDHGHRPCHDTGIHILETGYGERSLYRSFRHGKLVMATLEMIVA